MFPINILVFNIIPWKCQHLTFSFICNSSCHSWRHQYQPCCLNHPRAQPLKSLDASPTMLFSCTPHFSRHITPFSFSSNNHTTFETSTTTAYPSSVLMIDTHIFITMHYIITYTLILLFFSLINTSNPVTLHFFFFFLYKPSLLMLVPCWELMIYHYNHSLATYSTLVYFPSIMFLWINPNPA